MHPAFSVIFFTTASGAGYGLVFALGLFATVDQLAADQMLGLFAFLTALGLVTAGLLSSTFHLGHPERAWRAMSQWRSSWLSREGLVSLLTYVPILAFGFGWIYLGTVDGAWRWIGLAAAICSLLTVYCTSMIYVSLDAIPAWANRRVTPNYVILSMLMGMLLLNALVRLLGEPNVLFDALVIVLALQAWFMKARYWRFLDHGPGTSSAESATGLTGDVRLLDGPHTQANYLLKEMGYQIARKHAEKLRRIATALAFAVPALLTALILAAQATAGADPDPRIDWLTVVAAVSGIAGVLIERWLFFAEAKHVVTLYYGAQTV